jgi:hypothetical protein
MCCSKHIDFMRQIPKSNWLLALAIVFATTSAIAAESVSLKLLSVKKIWDGAHHNAFTDLIRFNNQWFCTFREAQGHVTGNGKIRVLTSSDGDQWKSAALLEESGIDLRDPKLSVTPDNRLMLTIGGSIYKDKKLISRQPKVSFSKGGTTWTAPKTVLKQGDWLWRVTWHKDRAYGMVYGMHTNSPWSLRIVESTDGEKFNLLQDLKVTSSPNEATIRFNTNDEALILVRREGDPKGVGDKNAWIGHAPAPYKDWTWHDAGLFIGGPNFIVLPNGKMVAAGRSISNKSAHTFVGWMTTNSVTPEITLPSGGDCSYPGMVWHDNKLWLTYYSSHEGQTSIYLAQIAVSN